MARRSSGGSGGGDAERRPPSRRRTRSQKPGAKRSASSRSEAERKEAAAKRASARQTRAKGTSARQAQPKQPDTRKTPAKRTTRRQAAPKPESAREAAAGAPSRARLQRPREIWGRRTVAVGTLLVGLALIGGLVLLVTGGDDDNESGSAATDEVKELQDKFLDRTVVDARHGISVRRPVDWSDSKERDVITLRSAGRCVAVHLSAPTAAKEAKGLRTDALKALRATFKNVQVAAGGSGRLGGVPTTSGTITLTDDNGKRRRILLSVGTGKKYAYLTEVVLGNPSCRDDLNLAQIALTSIEYTK